MNNPRLKKIIAKIERGEPVTGIFVLMADPAISEMVGYAGCDFVWIDTEHGMLDRREVYQHVMAAQSAGACAFVRVPGVDPQQIKNTLDVGPDGVIFPMIDTPELARKAVAACTYPIDDGIRGIGPHRAIRYGIDDEAAYLKIAKDEVWKIFQIESTTAVDNLEEIAKVPGYQSLFVGPADMGMSLVGRTPEEKSAYIDAAQRKMAVLAKENGKYCGSCAGPTKESCQAMLGKGVQWMTIGQDIRLVSLSLKSAVENIYG